jgi:hypothetical protein
VYLAVAMNGRESAAALRDFVALQLQFAEELAARGTLGLCATDSL